MLSRLLGAGAFALVMSNFLAKLLSCPLLSLPQHIGINRRARSESLRAAGHRKPGFGAGDGPERQFPDRQRHPYALLSLQQDDLSNADAGCDLARKRQIERLARPADG